MKSDDSRRAIGKLVSVSADKLVVELHRGTENFTVVGFDDVHYVARLGSYVVFPIQSAYIVAEVVGLRDSDAGTSRISSRANTDQLEKASSSKYLDLVPVGTLQQDGKGDFSFGVSVFPSLYADALYVLDSELDRIFDVAHSTEPSNSGCVESATRYKALTIGHSVIFKDYDVKVRIDEFFGGHSAVLGNTGSGKSCTVATVLQSLFMKPDEHVARGATFVLLDVNGEYAQALSGLPTSIGQSHLFVEGTVAQVTTTSATPTQTRRRFRLPHWYMSAEEWELLLRASEKTQQPVLRMALGLTSLFSAQPGSELNDLRNHIIACCIRVILQSDASTPTKKDRILSILYTFSTEQLNVASVRDKITVQYGEMADVEGLNVLLDGCIQEEITLPAYTCQEFPFDNLLAALELALLYEESHGNRQIRDYCSQMLTRYKSVRDREEFAFLRCTPDELDGDERNLDRFVERLLGYDPATRDRYASQVILLDMNDAGDEVVEIASAVISRLIFERLRRLEPRNSQPIHLVLEEAHRYVAEWKSAYGIDASKVFERIAKEGRKYGLFLIVASQRPSELSSTVLSQCSNFIVHRIQNPDDLQHIRQMTPFVSDSVLRRLPSLPKQHALIFGSAVNLPTTFKVREVSPKPKSDDAAIRDLWFKDASPELNAVEDEA